MKRAELASRIAKACGLTAAQAEGAIDALKVTIAEELKKNGKLYLHAFGTFQVRRRKARRGRNPKTGAAIDIPERMKLRWSPSSILEQAAGVSPKVAMAPRPTTAPPEVPQVMEREAAAAVIEEEKPSAAPAAAPPAPAPAPAVADEQMVRRARTMAKVNVEDIFLYFGAAVKQAIQNGQEPAEVVAEQLEQARATLARRVGPAVAAREDFVGDAFRAKLAALKAN